MASKAKQKQLEKMNNRITEFNTSHPVGSQVIVTKDSGEELITTVKAPAELLGGHTPVVWLKGISGCYDMDRVSAD